MKRKPPLFVFCVIVCCCFNRLSVFLALYICVGAPLYAIDNDEDYIKRDFRNKGIARTVEDSRSKWTTVSLYNADGSKSRIISKYKGEVCSDYMFLYAIKDSVLEITCKSIIGGKHPEPTERFVYGSNGLCKQIVYQKTDGTTGLAKTLTWRSDTLASITVNGITMQRHVFTYDNVRNTAMESIYQDKNPMPTRIVVRTYDSMGRLTSECYEYTDKGAYCTDVVSPSIKEAYKFIIVYADFDSHGNWRKSYYATRKGKVLRSKRRIEYYEVKK